MAAALRPESRHPRGDEVRLHPPNPRPWDLPPSSRPPLQSRPPRLRPRPQDPLGAARTAPARGPIPARSPALASPIRRRHRERARTYARTPCVASQLPLGSAPRTAHASASSRSSRQSARESGGGARAEVRGGGERVVGDYQARAPPPKPLVSFRILPRSFTYSMRLLWFVLLGLEVEKKGLLFTECRRSANLLRLGGEV